MGGTTGELSSVDGYMNIALEHTEEFVAGGRMKNSYGDVFIRGNNGGVSLSIPPPLA